jgi:DNA-directed RNA polymerase subunit RPC12/RpoP
MAEKQLMFREKSACSIKDAPMPITVYCPQCVKELEFWTDEDETTCTSCGYLLVKMDAI